MQIISVINYKGGVGKTTVAANLAGELAYRRRKVLLLDMDAQASLTFSFVTPDFWDQKLKGTKTIKSWFDRISQGDAPVLLSELVMKPERVNIFLQQRSKGSIDLLASHLGLINVDLELATLLGGASLQQTKRNYIKVHGNLRNALESLAATNKYDVILIDCPPNFNIVTKNAIIASDKILIPAKPDYLSTLGIDYLIRSTRELVTEYNEYANLENDTRVISPQMLGVVFTMIQISGGIPIAAQRQFISQTQRLGLAVFSAMFRENKTIFADAPQNGMPVVLNSYSSRTHSDIVTEIEAFVNEFCAKTGI
jgi:chromosome partitioning protein